MQSNELSQCWRRGILNLPTGAGAAIPLCLSLQGCRVGLPPAPRQCICDAINRSKHKLQIRCGRQSFVLWKKDYLLFRIWYLVRVLAT